MQHSFYHKLQIGGLLSRGYYNQPPRIIPPTEALKKSNRFPNLITDQRIWKCWTRQTSSVVKLHLV